MRIKIRYVVILLVCIFIPMCSGMIVPSVDGYVLNACNDDPIAKAQVTIKVRADLVNPADWIPVTLKETIVYTDDNGRYKSPFSIVRPKGIFFFSSTRPYISVFKEGYATSTLRREEHVSYLIPEREHSYELLQKKWSDTSYNYPHGFDMQNTSSNFKTFIRYADNYSEASRIAKTPKDTKFLELFCLRVRQTHAEFTRADHASLKAYLKAHVEWQEEYRDRIQVPGLPFEGCVNEDAPVHSPELLLTEEQTSYVFLRPICGDVKDVLTPRVTPSQLEQSKMTPMQGDAGQRPDQVAER